MGYAQTRFSRTNGLLKAAAALAAIFLFAASCYAQSTPQNQPSPVPWTDELNKYPGLLPELGRLLERFQRDIQFPPARSESRLLPLLPESAASYAAFSNYGDVAHQVLKIFRQELQQSSALRDWWQHGEMAATGPKLEDALEQLCQLHQYLGDEIVISGTMEAKEPSLLLVAELRKPGFKKFLQALLDQIPAKSKPAVRVLDLQDLAAVGNLASAQDVVILVRDDFVVAASDLAALRNFNVRLNRRSREFVSTPFGQRLVQEYHGGVTALAAADLHKILNQLPPGAQHSESLQHSGFGDVQYLVWDHKIESGQSISQLELSFSGPRHGAASWLAKPGPLSGFDFVSPNAILAATVMLISPAQIFDQLQELATLSHSNTFASVPLFEQSLKLNLKDDLLSLLGGEITLELDDVAPRPVWRAALSVKDADHLQQTLSTLLAALNFQTQRVDDAGVTYHTLRVPSAKAPLEIGYAFFDQHLIVGSSRDIVADAVRLHKSGQSLGKSRRFVASLPPLHSSQASALFYQDPIAMATLQLRQVSPQSAESLLKLSREATPAVLCLYGEEAAIREASTSPALDAATVLIGAAVAIPNLLRSKIAANEASAVGSVRSVNTAQAAYAATYPKQGFAPNLSKFGADPRGPAAGSPDHAGFLDETLANDSCSGDSWCTKSGFQFRLTGTCNQRRCNEYVVVATPVSTSTGTRSFCSTSDGVIHLNVGPPLTSPLSPTECKSWPPIN